jgi:BRCT domain type II-containing protein
VGSDLEFPFAFMCGKDEDPSSDSSEADYKRPNSEAFSANQELDLRKGEIIPMVPAQPKSPQIWSRKQQSTPATPQARRQRSTKNRESADVSDKKRSLSLNSLDDLKTPKTPQDRISFLVRLGRSWSRRRSAAT